MYHGTPVELAGGYHGGLELRGESCQLGKVGAQLLEVAGAHGGGQAAYTCTSRHAHTQARVMGCRVFCAALGCAALCCALYCVTRGEACMFTHHLSPVPGGPGSSPAHHPAGRMAVAGQKWWQNLHRSARQACKTAAQDVTWACCTLTFSNMPNGPWRACRSCWASTKLEMPSLVLSICEGRGRGDL